LRGLHWQDDPHGEGKLVRCVRGAVYDVAVDIRPGSPTRRQWAAWELTAENGLAVFIPPGFAHGFQTLAPDSEVFYQMTTRYNADSGRRLRWDDPALGIPWPIRPPILSARDSAL
jgi:dTDP-4-dehydrorhamnose 3,5-epimerase